MCGIFGLIGKDCSLKVLTDGLKDLEYRGYDSAGVAYFKNRKIYSLKKVGKVENLENSLNLNEKIFGGIAHTRWATHGKPSITNCHPQKAGNLYMVHNGIIENYLKLKQKYNLKCDSETDTEVAVKLLDFLYKKNKKIFYAKNKQEKTDCMLKAIEILQKQMIGSWAIAVIAKDIFGTVFAFKNQSPLVVGTSKNINLISSDISPICKFFEKNIFDAFFLKDYEIAKIDKNIEFFNKKLKKISKKSKKIKNLTKESSKKCFKYFMEKEIYETPSAILSTYKSIINLKNIKIFELIKESKKITFIGCGTAYHACLVGKYYFEKYLNIKCEAILASEFRYNKNIFQNGEVVFAITQSGETADTIAGVKLAKESGLKTIVLTNVKNSSITKVSDFSIFTNAGREFAVAATKTFSCQIIALFAITQKILKNKLNIKKYSQNLQKNIENIKNIEFFNEFFNKNKFFFIGKGIDSTLALEGALKLKEIAYLHSEGYPAGELKHGTLSLVDNQTLVVAIITDKNLKDKTLNSAFEAKARGAKLLLVSQLDLSQFDYKIKIEEEIEDLNCINAIIPLQFLAYFITLKLGYNPDRPRNLAKSVTVE